MPTTLVGLLIFVALLTPGTCYAFRREANSPVTSHLSPVRETARLVGVSVCTDMVVLALLLGLHGVMNEAELHVLKSRMYQGKLNKAKRGELFALPPIGYVRRPTGEWAIDPDEQVQAVVRLIFDQFDREATMHGLLRYLVHHQVRLPVRPAGGPSKGQLEWHRPSRATLLNVLRHPCYAGAADQQSP